MLPNFQTSRMMSECSFRFGQGKFNVPLSPGGLVSHPPSLAIIVIFIEIPFGRNVSLSLSSLLSPFPICFSLSTHTQQTPHPTPIILFPNFLRLIQSKTIRLSKWTNWKCPHSNTKEGFRGLDFPQLGMERLLPNCSLSKRHQKEESSSRRNWNVS